MAPSPTALASEVLLWADGICINQADVPEKNVQVAMMRRIYESARKVVVWLGPPDSAVEAALREAVPSLVSMHHNTIATVDQARLALMRPEDAVGLDFTHFDSRHLQTLVRLAGRPWFSRIWVVQEFVAARDVCFMCGSRGNSPRGFRYRCSHARVLCPNLESASSPRWTAV